LEGTKIAPTIMRMLEEANLLLTNESSPTFKRITGIVFNESILVSIVTFKEYEYLITLDKMSIYVYVRARNKEEN